MFFPTIFSFTILMATVSADLHNDCACMNGNTYNNLITKAACNAYNAADYKWGQVKYNGLSGRCVGVNNGKLAGKQWESACKTAAQHTSFLCRDDKNTCWASESAVKGSC